MPPDPTSAGVVGAALTLGCILLTLSYMRRRWWLFAALMTPLSVYLTARPMDAQGWAWLALMWGLLALPWLLLWRIVDAVRERRAPWIGTPEGQSRVALLHAALDSMDDETRAVWLRGGRR